MRRKIATYIAACLVSITPAAQAASLSVTELSFGEQQIFTTSSRKTLTLQNTGTTTERIWQLKLVGDAFSKTTSDCPSSLAPWQRCTITFTFSPLGTGWHAASFRISTSSVSRSVPLKGMGVSPPPAKLGPKKWNPGHYVQLGFGVSANDVSKISASLPTQIKGVMVPYSWAQLEPSKGTYDFSRIIDDLNTLRANGKRLVVMVQDKSFKATTKCVPAYMREDPLYKGGQLNTYAYDGSVKGCKAKRWEPVVMDRMIALYKALGNAVDKDPNFEGVVTQETAVGLRDRATVRQYVDQWKRWASAVPAAFPTSLISLWTNWSIWDYMPELLEHLYRNGIGFGGPDMVPAPYYTTEAYPYFPKYAGKTYVMMGVQPTFLSWETNLIRDGHLTLNDVFHFGVTDPQGINATHLFWWYFVERDAPYDFTHTFNVIRENGAKINWACPQNIVCQ